MPRILPCARNASNVRAMWPDEKSLSPGVLVRIGAAVQRLTAPNASLMTGPGTNTYVLGDPPLAVLDPGPDDPGHRDRIMKAVPHPRFVFVTHTHRDHSSGARALATATGALIVGLTPPKDGRQDVSCVPDVQPAQDQVFVLSLEASQAGGGRLRAIHTPGHASNHVCYLLEEEGLLFSGDHVLDGVTPVILAPDGDMGAYIDSLQRLKQYALRAIAPGHGHVMENPIDVIDKVIAHRGRREAKVLAVLDTLGKARLADLLPRVYNDVRPELLPIAQLTLEAHLIKLARAGRAVREGDEWRACRE
ncbi:MAG TPA: MBL fold metallo-hydrolase [Steroidobacteraceae bacterium]|jgi:glyoxylase-like metal-dependent hydrolase (beta-lactamase superfamily II)